MHSLIQKTYDRADVLMSAGCSTFVSAAMILVIPRFGIAMIEILIGIFVMGCAFAARARLRNREQVQPARGLRKTGAKWFDRYDVAMILAVIAVQGTAAGSLHRLGWSEGTIRIFPLFLLGAAILLKPRLLKSIERRVQKKSIRDSSAVGPANATTQIAGEGAQRWFE
jgi:hypothetical protein